MNIITITPKKNIFEEIIPLLENNELDYSSNLVVFPGKRPSHFLRAEISKRIKKSFIPPLTFSMDEFIDFIFEKMDSKRKIDLIDAISVLYEIQRTSPKPVGKDNFISPDSFFPIGLKIFNDLEELFIEEINIQQLRDFDSFISENMQSTKENLQSLSYFYEEFYKKIDNLRYSTRSSRYRSVSENISETFLNNFKKIIFAGFFALTRSERRIFKKLLSFKNTVFIFQEGEGLKEKIKELDLDVIIEEHKDINPDIHFYSAPDTHGQVYALNYIIENKPVTDITNIRTVIVLPSSETLFPLLRQGPNVLDEYKYNISLGYPLYRTPLYGFLNNLMELISSMDNDLIYIPHYMSFMLHPYTKNIYFKGIAEITRIILHSLEERFTKKRTRTFLSLHDIEGEVSHIMDKISGHDREINIEEIKTHLRTIHQNTIEKFIFFENMKDFAKKCREVIEFIYNSSTAKLHPLFHPFAEAFIKQIDILGKSEMKNIYFEKTVTYFTFFRKYIMNFRAPFEGTPLRGLQILGFLETRNIKFDYVFFLDANEGIIPDTKKEDSLLPLKVRERLGIPTYMDRDKIMAYYFDVLLKGAKEVHLFFIENDKKERSRFVERLLWEKQKKDNIIETEKYIRQLQYKINLITKKPEPIEKTKMILKFLKDFTYSPTTLDDYLKCQLKFYYNYVLSLDKKEEITGEIEKVDIGKIVHTILHFYFSKRKNRILKEEDINTIEMENLVNNIFEKEYSNNITGATYLLRNQVRKRLKELLVSYYADLIKKEKVSIIDVEKELIIKINGFNLKGRIDSIEKRNNKIFILDYKTPSNANRLKIKMDKLDLTKRDTWSNAIGSLQIPIYLLLFSERAKTSPKNLRGVYLLIGRTKIDGDIEISPFREEEIDKATNIVREVTLRLLQEIVDPSIHFEPPKDIKAICPSCNYSYICGTQWVGRSY